MTEELSPLIYRSNFMFVCLKQKMKGSRVGGVKPQHGSTCPSLVPGLRRKEGWSSVAGQGRQHRGHIQAKLPVPVSQPPLESVMRQCLQ